MRLHPSIIILSIKISELTGGQKNHSICVRIYSNKKKYESNFWKFSVWFVDKLFWFDKNHCRKAYIVQSKEIK